MKDKTRKLLKWFGNGTFILALAIGIGAAIDIIIKRSQLPPGTCPLNDSRPWLYVAIALCAVALILSIFEKKSDRK